MLLIVNPAARRGAGRRLLPEIRRELDRRGLAHDLVLTEGPSHGVALARDAARRGIRIVVAAGGDGTLHDVANGLLQSPSSPRLGLIPIGTGNDLVKVVPGTRTRSEAYDTLARAETAWLDVGMVRWDGQTEYFLNAMGTGIDVEVVRQMQRQRRWPGGVAYLLALVKALVRYRALPVELVLDGRTYRMRVMNLAVANGPSIGGTFRVCPDADIRDGLLDICVIEEMPLWRNARLVPHVIRGTHVGRPGVTMMQTASVRVRVDGGWTAFQVDGELREARAGSLEVTVLPHRLEVITAGASPREGTS